MKTKTLKITLPILIALCLCCILAFAACGNAAETVNLATTEASTNVTETTEQTNEQTDAGNTTQDEDETTTQSGENETEETGTEETVTGYVISFNVDEHATVTVYDTQDVTGAGTTAGTIYSRDGSTGTILTDGNGQVNFVVTADEGYELAPIVVTGTYKNVKTPADTGTENAYRITKIGSDLTVTIEVNEAGTKYEGTFVLGEGVQSVLISDTQDMTNAATGTKAYARNGETGEIDSSGSGQINFIVVLEDGYAIDGITIDGGYKNLKNDPEADGSADYYRITKITSDLTITITATHE